jgi:hypothetical protein
LPEIAEAPRGNSCQSNHVIDREVDPGAEETREVGDQAETETTEREIEDLDLGLETESDPDPIGKDHDQIGEDLDLTERDPDHPEEAMTEKLEKIAGADPAHPNM